MSLLDSSWCRLRSNSLRSSSRLGYSGRGFTCLLQLNVEDHGRVKGWLWKRERIKDTLMQAKWLQAVVTRAWRLVEAVQVFNMHTLCDTLKDIQRSDQENTHTRTHVCAHTHIH